MNLSENTVQDLVYDAVVAESEVKRLKAFEAASIRCRVISTEPGPDCTRANWGHDGRGMAILLELPEGMTSERLREMIKAGGSILIMKEQS